MAKWYFNFQSVRGINYRVEIGGKSGNTDQALVPAQSPFETEEDTSDDWFTPVRLQSGYIRVVGNNWDLMPTTATNRPVTLTRTDDDTVLWRGYIKMDTYQGRVYDDYQVREYPVVCQLSVLESQDYAATEGSMPNFAELLYNCLSGGTWSHIIWQGSDAINDWLTKRVSSACLLSRSDRGVISYKYNKLELLEEVCKFFGVTARTFGSDLYFVAPDWSVNFGGMYFSDLQRIANGYSVSPTSITYDSYDGDDIFTDTESEFLYVGGIRKATVTADPSEEDLLIEFPQQDFEYKNRILPMRPSVTQYGSLYVFKDFWNQPPLVNKLSAWYWTFVSGTTPDCRPECVDTYNGTITFKHSYAWSYYFGMLNDVSNQLWIETHDAVSLYDGILALSGETSFVNYSTDTESIHNATGTVQVCLQVGDQYYDQGTNDWTSSETWNTINIGGELGDSSGTGTIISNRVLDSTDPNYTGHGWKITNPSYGKLTLRMRQVHLTSGWDGNDHLIRFANLQLKFYRNTSTRYGEKTLDYTATNNTAFSDSVKVNLAFASDNNYYYGNSMICEHDGTYCQTLAYNGNYYHPEQWLANRIAAFGAGRRELLVYNINVDDVGGDITPATKLNADSIGRYPYSVSVRWADDVATVRMTEV